MATLIPITVMLVVDGIDAKAVLEDADLRPAERAIHAAIEHWRMEEGIFDADSDFFVVGVHSVTAGDATTSPGGCLPRGADAEPPSASPPETGIYLVLSSGHITVKTAELLDRWAAADDSDRPMMIASTNYGWFVSTREPEVANRADVPRDLDAVLRFARNQGYGYLLFDADGDTIDALPFHPW